MNTYYVADMDTRVSVELWKLDWTAPAAAAAEGDGVVATVAASCVAIKYTHTHTHTDTDTERRCSPPRSARGVKPSPRRKCSIVSVCCCLVCCFVVGVCTL